MGTRRNAIRAGQAFVEMFTDDKRVLVGLARLRRTFTRFGSQIGATFNQLGYRLIGIFGVVNASLLGTVAAAARVENSFTRLGFLFGRNIGKAETFVQSLAASTGRTGLFVRESLVSFQAFFKGLQFGEDAATKLSEAMTRLQQDFAAATGQSSGESLRRFIAALAGSPEVLDQFGIDLKEASLNAVLFAHGIEGVRQATEVQKTLARMLLIFDRLGKQGSIGAATKTMTKFSTILDLMKGNAIEAAAAIGFELKPAFIEIADTIKAVNPVFRELIKWNGRAVRGFARATVVAGGLGIAFIAIGSSLQFLSFVLSGFALLFTPFTILVKALIGVTSIIITAASSLFGLFGVIIPLGAAIGAIILVWKNWGAIVATVSSTISQAMASVSKGFRNAAIAVRVNWGIAATFFRQTIQYMLQAVQKGKVDKAFELAFFSIQLGMAETKNVVITSFEEMTQAGIDFARKVSDAMRDKIHKAINNLLTTIGDFPRALEVAAVKAETSGEKFRIRAAAALSKAFGGGRESEYVEDQLQRDLAAAEARGDAKLAALSREFTAVRRLAERNLPSRDPALLAQRREEDRLRQAEADARRATSAVERDALLSRVKNIRRQIKALQGEDNEYESVTDYLRNKLSETIGNAVERGLGVQTGLAASISRGLTGNVDTQNKIADNTAATASILGEINEQVSKFAPAFGP